MDCDRRTILLASLLLTAACAKASGDPVKRPVKARNASRSPVPAAIAPRPIDGWTAFKAAYLQRDGRIIDTGNGGISHSEGQGYGMLFAEQAGDRAAFDSLFAWTERTLARKDVALYSWRFAPAEATPVADINNATDGDILIAWALMRAHDRWNDATYAARAGQVRGAIAAHLVGLQGGRTLLLPALTGFVTPGRTTVNPSYYVWPALDRFERADRRSAVWHAVIADGQRLIRDARFGAAQLPGDWIDVDTTGAVAPAAGKPPRFGFDAIRVPLYAALGSRLPLASNVVGFWRSLANQGASIPAWVDVVTGERAPFALSQGGMAVVRRLLGKPSPEAIAGETHDYYSDALKMLAGL